MVIVKKKTKTKRYPRAMHYLVNKTYYDKIYLFDLMIIRGWLFLRNKSHLLPLTAWNNSYKRPVPGRTISVKYWNIIWTRCGTVGETKHFVCSKCYICPLSLCGLEIICLPNICFFHCQLRSITCHQALQEYSA